MKLRSGRWARISLGWILALAGACRSATPETSEWNLRTLRQAVQGSGVDSQARKRLAVGEMLARGGEPRRAKAALKAALQRLPHDPTLRMLRAVQSAVHSAPSEALDDFVASVDASLKNPQQQTPFLAEVAVAALEDLREVAPRFSERVRPALGRWVGESAKLGVPATQAMADLQVSLALQRGETAAARSLAKAQGCVSSWRVAGPFGPYAMLGFDRKAAAEADSALRAKYALGAGRGVSATREASTVGCELSLGDATSDEGGVWIAEALVEVEADGERVLRLAGDDSLEVRLDGAVVARLDRRRQLLPRVRFVPLRLAAGTHRLRIKLASRQAAPRLSVALAKGGALGVEPLRDADPWSAYLAVAVAIGRGNLIEARQLLQKHAPLEDGALAFLLLRGLVALNDPLVAAEQRRDEARRVLRTAAARDPQAWYPHLQLARLLALEGTLLPAIEQLRSAVARWPGVVSLQMGLADLLRLRGWHSEEERVVAQARALVPEACAPQRAMLSIAEQRRRAAEVETWSKAVVACDARSQARLAWLVRQRRWDEAGTEIRRLAALASFDDARRALWLGRLEAARGRNDRPAAEQVLATLQQALPRESSLVLALADLALADGDLSKAQQALSAALVTDPAGMANLRRPLWAIGVSFELESYRVNGSAVIAEFVASGRSYDAPQVMVLDSTVVRVFADGSSLELTHNIFKVQSQEAVNAQGEYRIPEGAQMLKLRTVKADGRILEPDPVSGKDSLSMPNLLVGDFIEAEYLRASPSPAGFPGGMLGERFYFRSFEVPLDRSELTYLVPSSLEPIVEPRGPAPPLERQTLGDLQVLRWRSLGNAALTREPQSVDPREFVPSVQVGVGASWKVLLDGIADLLIDKDPYDPNAAALAQRIVADVTAQGASAKDSAALLKAKRLYAWVLANIDDTQDAFGSAPMMLAARRGNRSRVLRYLLGLAGLRAQLVLARSATSDPTPSRLADEQTYEHLLVAVEIKGQRHFLATGQRWAPFGFIPVVLRGQQALVIQPTPGERWRLPVAGAAADRRSVHLDVDLRNDGSAELRVRETLRGNEAVVWRQQLEGIAPALLRGRFEESYVGSLFPGSSLLDLNIEQATDAEKPLVLAYRLQLPDSGRWDDSRLRLHPLLATQALQRYARLSSRTTPQWVAPPVDTELEADIHLPSRAELNSIRLPAVAKVEGLHGLRFTAEWKRKDRLLQLRRHVHLPLARVEASQYADLVAFCRDADAAENREVVITIPP